MTLTYTAAASRSLPRGQCAQEARGIVKAGDRVMIPTCRRFPRRVISDAGLRAHRAPYSVVFSGFSSKRSRISTNDCGAKVVITADGSTGRRPTARHQAQRRRGSARRAQGHQRHRRAAHTKQGSHHAAGSRLTGCTRKCLQVSLPSAKAEPFDSSLRTSFSIPAARHGRSRQSILHLLRGYLLGCHLTTNTYFDLRPRTSTSHRRCRSVGSPGTATSPPASSSRGRHQL